MPSSNVVATILAAIIQRDGETKKLAVTQVEEAVKYAELIDTVTNGADEIIVIEHDDLRVSFNVKYETYSVTRKSGKDMRDVLLTTKSRHEATEYFLQHVTK